MYNLKSKPFYILTVKFDLSSKIEKQEQKKNKKKQTRNKIALTLLFLYSEISFWHSDLRYPNSAWQVEKHSYVLNMMFDLIWNIEKRKMK